MAQAASAIQNRPAWVDLATSDPAAARTFYSTVLGWQIEVNPDPQYGGYALARVGGQDAAGIGGTQSPDQPTAWSFYVGSDDLGATAERVKAAGGAVIAEPFAVGDQGRMAVFRDPTGAVISAWEPARMGGFQTEGPNAFGWAELNARGVDKALPFYREVFGWTAKTTPSEPQPYTEFQLDGTSVAGALEMSPELPGGIPSYWMVYFTVDDVDRANRVALDAGGRQVVVPQDFPGGRFSIVSDPQGAMFGLLRVR
ncbi:MAG TPA: VOC family protein [Candidatus Limnocylindrales bacterium]